MGGSASKVHREGDDGKGTSMSSTNATAKRSVLDVVRIMLPVYFSSEAVTEGGKVIMNSQIEVAVNPLFFSHHYRYSTCQKKVGSNH